MRVISQESVNAKRFAEFSAQGLSAQGLPTLGLSENGPPENGLDVTPASAARGRNR
ncbi:MAG: hypothetical protein CFE34_14010 [Rhodobacteraceae bacterium PARR1]|nr:MAG: hypothetical protein CFE34_14010 [Rhodobacteraceae bacterium PARR1]